MALVKPIKQEDGIVTNYHRILYIQTTINQKNAIAVTSYVDREASEREKQGAPSPVYSKSKTFTTDYNPGMTVESAYEYLKTREEFEGAQDDV